MYNDTLLYFHYLPTYYRPHEISTITSSSSILYKLNMCIRVCEFILCLHVFMYLLKFKGATSLLLDLSFISFSKTCVLSYLTTHPRATVSVLIVTHMSRHTPTVTHMSRHTLTVTRMPVEHARAQTRTPLRANKRACPCPVSSCLMCDCLHLLQQRSSIGDHTQSDGGFAILAEA